MGLDCGSRMLFTRIGRRFFHSDEGGVAICDATASAIMLGFGTVATALRRRFAFRIESQIADDASAVPGADEHDGQFLQGGISSNAVVESPHALQGFVRRPWGPVPSVTVRLQNMAFDFIVIDAILNLVRGGGYRPAFPCRVTATMFGEDLNTVGAGCQ